MMIELLLAMALAAAMLPFLSRQESARVARAENIRAGRDMAMVRTALEKYIDARKKEFGTTIGRRVFRVNIADLEPYGLTPTDINRPEQYQLRVIKTADRAGRAFMQGIVIMETGEMTPMRTREIAEITGGGYAAGGKLHSIYGTWETSATIWNARFADNAILDVTRTSGFGTEFLRRLPSDSASDATMLSDISLGGHAITGARSIFSEVAKFSEFLNTHSLSASRAVIENSPTLDGRFTITDANVNGAISSDSRVLETNRMTVSGMSRFNNVTANELWTGDLYVHGASVRSDGAPATLNINRNLDMTGGRISAGLAFVGFTGSVTPYLSVTGKISDPNNNSFYWDAAAQTAELSDMSIPNLGIMMRAAVRRESGTLRTDTERTMSQIANNTNATVADYARAIAEIKTRVTAKYHLLNLD